MPQKKRALLIASVLATAASAHADTGGAPTSDCANQAVTPPLPQSGQLVQLNEAISQQGQPAWFNGLFYLESDPVRKNASNPALAQLSNGAPLSPGDYAKASMVYFTAMGQGSPAVTSRAQQSAYLQSIASTMTTPEKIQVLSWLGDRLAQGYNSNQAIGTENRDLNQLFQNLVSGGTQGGICGDIHTYIAALAKDLGFTDTGIYSGLWQQDPKNSGTAGGHVVAYFRDPTTGVYYTQNYSSLINTGQTNVQGAMEIGLRAMGPLTGVSYVESPNGRIHTYVPQTSLWAKSVADSEALFNPANSAVMSVAASENSQTIGLQWQPLKGQYQAKAFFVHSDVRAQEGNYSVDIVGLSGQANFNKKFDHGTVDEIGAVVSAYAGAQQLSAPVLNSLGTFSSESRTNAIANVDIQGYARINQTTGKIELKSFTTDTQIPFLKDNISRSSGVPTELSAGIDQGWQALPPVHVGVERTFELVPKWVGGPQSHLQTEYDKISVVYDTSGNRADRPLTYLMVGTNVYVMEGLENRSAIAVKQTVEAAVDKGRLGTFTVGMDLAKYVSNKSQDPFYNQPAGVDVRFNWDKAINKHTDVGAQVAYTKGTSNFPFSTIGQVFPGLNSTHWVGSLYLREKW